MSINEGIQRDCLRRLMQLKSLQRAGWIRAQVPDVESVAAHSWGVATLAFALCPRELDREKVMAMALIHDMAEIITGDITPYDKVEPGDKIEREREALRNLVGPLDNAEEILSLQHEYQERSTPESLFVHRCDKLDMMIQAESYMESYPELDLEEFRISALELIMNS